MPSAGWWESSPAHGGFVCPKRCRGWHTRRGQIVQGNPPSGALSRCWGAPSSQTRPQSPRAASSELDLEVAIPGLLRLAPPYAAHIRPSAPPSRCSGPSPLRPSTSRMTRRTGGPAAACAAALRSRARAAPLAAAPALRRRSLAPVCSPGQSPWSARRLQPRPDSIPWRRGLTRPCCALPRQSGR
ncbi:hypothetical protein C2845_PM01G48140 [Panicum miliaceum]|uniref:Uncharacterized protein n=1 Tax=Panicum miliaceum TaxID=4540 RepID=A0A3L6TP15_PANMI|nr:hypothetical protein C2845_PM01G48140 [Panicum miliaceum]